MRPAFALRPARLAACLFLLLGAPAARAVEYEVEVDVEGEAGLRLLREEGQLSQASFDALLALLRDPVDLNEEDRSALHSLPNLTLGQAEAIEKARAGRTLDGLEDLVGLGLLTPSQARQLRPFVTARPSSSPTAPLSGRVRFSTAWAPSDPLAPPGLLQTRVAGPWNLTAGVAATTTRQWLDEVSVDRPRHALLAPPPGYSLRVPKLFMQITRPRWTVLLGSFRVGSGQRLTLDTSRRAAPDGFYPDDVVSFGAGLASYCRYSKGERASSPCSVLERNTFVTPDFTWSEGFRGLAMQVDVLRRGEVAVVVRGFGSYQRRSAYQYDLYDRSLDPKTNRRCSESEQGSSKCAPPSVFVEQGDSRGPAAAFAYTTLPGLYDELVAGGNAALALGRDARLGVTGYWATHRWNAPGLALRLRDGPQAPFGAAGIDGKLRLGAVDLAAEVARSLDPNPRTGGSLGVVQSTLLSLGSGEVALDLRYYGQDFLNPYAHAPAAPDEYEGSRNRNELGARVRWAHRISAFRLHGGLDLWRQAHPEADGTRGTSHLDASFRADFTPSRALGIAAWLDYRDKDLSRAGKGQCFDTPFEPGPAGTKLPCAGARYQVTGRASANLLGPWLQAALQYAHAFVDDAPRSSLPRQDANAWLTLGSSPTDQLDLRVHSRYLGSGLFGETPRARSLGNAIEIRWRRPSLSVRARYDLRLRLDARPADAPRIPSPEHRLQLETEVSL